MKVVLLIPLFRTQYLIYDALLHQFDSMVKHGVIMQPAVVAEPQARPLA
jgi:hypothetical protein